MDENLSDKGPALRNEPPPNPLGLAVTALVDAARVDAARQEVPSRPWIAYYHDRSAIAIFPTEIEALRYAVENSMVVKELPAWGEVEF